MGHNKEFEDVSLETVMDIFREQTVKGIISKTNEQVLIVSCYPRSEPISRIRLTTAVYQQILRPRSGKGDIADRNSTVIESERNYTERIGCTKKEM